MLHSDIILVTLQSHGHFRPLMALGDLLFRHSNGTVRSHLFLPIMNDRELPTGEYPNVEIVRLEVPEEVVQETKIDRQFQWFGKNGDSMIPSCCVKAEGLNVMAVVYDSFLSWGQKLCGVLGVKGFAFCSFALHTFYLIEKLGWRGKDASDEERTIAGLGTLSATCMPYVDERDPDVFIARGHARSVIANDSPCQPGFESLKKIVERDVLISSPGFDKGMVHPLGYLNDRSDNPIWSTHPNPVIDWLDTQADRSVIFIALGSWVQLHVCDILELAEALKSMGHPFLWAIRKRVGDSKASNGPPDVRGGDQFENEEQKVPSDEYGLPVGFIDEVQHKSLVVPWVDQRRVLMHRALKLFVTHCGWNSLTESVALTPIPKAFIPVAGEQGLNAEVAERFWGVGKQLWLEGMPKTLQRDVIIQRLNECLTDQSILQRSEKLHRDHQRHSQTDFELCVKRLLAEIQS